MQMKVSMGKAELEMGGKYMTWLEDSSHLLDRPDALRQRLEEDGYLLLRGFHDRNAVAGARLELLQWLRAKGRLAADAPYEVGLIGPDNKPLGFRHNAAAFPEFRKLTDAQRTLRLFESLLGGSCLTFDTKWFRAVEKGAFSGAHYDMVYMGRGTERVYTVWSPLMEISPETGGLAICTGSHRFENVKATYGRSDYEKVDGWFSVDPVDIVDRFGGRWATTHFFEGDALVFGMFTMHGSLTNTTGRYRLSCDARYQSASEPFDPRWHGASQIGESDRIAPDRIGMAQARQQWGLG